MKNNKGGNTGGTPALIFRAMEDTPPSLYTTADDSSDDGNLQHYYFRLIVLLDYRTTSWSTNDSKSPIECRYRNKMVLLQVRKSLALYALRYIA